MTINDAEMKQNKFNTKHVALNNYFPRYEKYIEAKNRLMNNEKNFYEGRQKIIEGFKEGIFSLKSDDKFEDQQTSKKPTKDDVNALYKWVNKEELNINKELFKKHFNFRRPSNLFKYLYQINNRKKNNELVSLINSGLKDLKKEIKKMSEDEIKIEKSDKTVEIVKEILKFNKQVQKGQGLKILTSN